MTVATNGETLRGSWLIAADGVGSAVRNRVFGRNIVHYAPALEALVEVDSAALEIYGRHALFDLGGMWRGYGWIFPKSDHLNVGVYSPFGAKGLREELARFMGRYPVLSLARSVRYQGYAIPVHNRRGEFARGRVWLVGAAAGLAESVFGEGIYFALKSALRRPRRHSWRRGASPPVSTTRDCCGGNSCPNFARRASWPGCFIPCLSG